MAQSNSPQSLNFKAYIVNVQNGQHFCSYIVTASSRQGAAMIATAKYNEMFNTRLGPSTVEIKLIIEPGDVYCISDNYDDIDFEYPEI